MEDTMTDIFNNQSSRSTNTQVEPILSIEEMMNNNVQSIPQAETPAIQNINSKQKMDKILLIQIILLITWAILTALIYFFGYDFFEPFIKV
ncbi:MAG: hypothetical protein J6O56_04680 [Bacilli bacterium]|nr:hypothetical protein [Bacilli bacterium]